jgi:aminoglycoside/choline kinase family phosphotransferase
VLAADVDEGWLLLEDIGAAVTSDDAEPDELAVRRLVELQRAFAGDTEELLRAGCPARPFTDLPAQVAGVLADPVAQAWIDVTPARAADIVEWLGPAAAAVAGAGFPDTLVHGDFHVENVAVVDGAAVIFDWSDAAVGHPLVDALTWASWFEDDPGRGERAWAIFLDAWADVCPAERVAAIRPQLAGLAAAYHTVSYAGIVAGLEPRCRASLAYGLSLYFGQLDAAVPR